MTSIFKKIVKGAKHTLLIMTEDEREFGVAVLCQDAWYIRNGFASWLDAYEHGVEVIGEPMAAG